MSFVIVFLVTLAGAFWFISRVFKSKKKPIAVTATSDTSGVAEETKSKMPIKVSSDGVKTVLKYLAIAFVILVGIVGVFFTDIIVDFDWNTIPIVRVMESKVGEGTSVWLWIAIPAAIIVLVWLVKFFKSNESPLSMLIAGAFIIALLLSVPSAIFLLGLIVNEFTDTTGDYMKIQSGELIKTAGRCINITKLDKLSERQIYFGEKCVSISHTDRDRMKRIALHTVGGLALDMEFHPDFIQEHRRIIDSIKPKDFLEVTGREIGRDGLWYYLGQDKFEEKGIWVVDIYLVPKRTKKPKSER